MLNTDFMIQVAKATVKGVPVTLEIVIVSLILALPISFGFALLRLYKIKIGNEFVKLYVSFIRGTPIIAQILIVYSAFPSLLASIIGKDAFAINPINYAYIVFTINAVASLTETFRSALQTVDRGQYEAGMMVGMNSIQTFVRIILPQALVSAIPNMANITLGLVKNSALAFIMSVKDITAIAKTEAAFNYSFFEAYLVLWVYYLVISYTAELIFKTLELYFGRYRKQIKKRRQSKNDKKLTSITTSERQSPAQS